MKKVLLFLVLLLLGLYYINSRTHWITNRTYEVKDISKQETIILHKIKTQEHVFSYFIHIKGHLNGNAKIRLFQSSSKGSLYRDKNLSGNINIKWGGDWYTDTLKIEYEPIDVKDGELSLEYNFKGL